jgi:chromatin remodeling complex protein RSC6
MARVTKKSTETQQTPDSSAVPVAQQEQSVEPKQKKSKAKTSTQEPTVTQSSSESAVSEPKQKKSRAKSTEPVVQTEEPVVQEKKKRAPSKKQTQQTQQTQESEQVQSEQPSSESSQQSSSEEVQSEKRSRKVVTQDTLRSDLEQLKQNVEDEIQRLRTSEQKNKGVKFLKNVNRSLKMLHSDLNKVLKSKVKTVRSKNTSSGFMKPVKISSEMALFTSWDASKLYSRVDVTKFLCKYIKDNTLQNPEDRRQILCDSKLASLLKIDTATSSPLTYPGLQQYIQQHFIPVTDETVVSEESAKP